MGQVDVERQALNVFRMQLLGAEVEGVSSGSKTLKDAVNEALRDWVATVENTHYCLGSVMGPHPYPWMVRTFHHVIGEEARAQCLKLLDGLPDLVVACVGGGSNAAGIFSGFSDTESRLVGVEPAGGAAVGRGVPGVVHGMASYLMQDEVGQVQEAESISAGLDYPGVGPEHAYLSSIGRAEYPSVSDQEVQGQVSVLGFRTAVGGPRLAKDGHGQSWPTLASHGWPWRVLGGTVSDAWPTLGYFGQTLGPRSVFGFRTKRSKVVFRFRTMASRPAVAGHGQPSQTATEELVSKMPP